MLNICVFEMSLRASHLHPLKVVKLGLYCSRKIVKLGLNPKHV